MNNTLPSEPFLVKALSAGDIKAFNDLFKLYANRIYRFAFGYLKSESDSEELVQDVFMKVWERRSELNENLSFKSYLFTIAFNIIRKHFAKKSLNNRYFEYQILDDLDLKTVQNIDYKSTKEHLDQLIAKLPPKRRSIFVKSRLEGYSVKEIAEEMGTSPKTVENQLGDALKFIREHLRKENLPVIIFFVLFYS